MSTVAAFFQELLAAGHTAEAIALAAATVAEARGVRRGKPLDPITFREREIENERRKQLRDDARECPKLGANL